MEDDEIERKIAEIERNQMESPHSFKIKVDGVSVSVEHVIDEEMDNKVVRAPKIIRSYKKQRAATKDEYKRESKIEKQKSLSPAERDSQDIELLKIANKVLKDKVTKQATAIDRLILQKQGSSNVNDREIVDHSDAQRDRPNPFLKHEKEDSIVE